MLVIIIWLWNNLSILCYISILITNTKYILNHTNNIYSLFVAILLIRTLQIVSQCSFRWFLCRMWVQFILLIQDPWRLVTWERLFIKFVMSSILSGKAYFYILVLISRWICFLWLDSRHDWSRTPILEEGWTPHYRWQSLYYGSSSLCSWNSRTYWFEHL